MNNPMIDFFGTEIEIKDIYSIGGDIEEFKLLWLFDLTRVIATITLKKGNEISVIKGAGMSPEKLAEWCVITNMEIELEGKQGKEFQLENGLIGFVYK